MANPLSAPPTFAHDSITVNTNSQRVRSRNPNVSYLTVYILYENDSVIPFHTHVVQAAFCGSTNILVGRLRLRLFC